MINPFDPHADPDRHYIWQRLVQADSEAFVLGDWSMVENDYDAENFEGIRAHGSDNPDDWNIAFADVKSYRENWLAASRQFLQKQFVGVSHREAVYRRTRLTEIEIVADRGFEGRVSADEWRAVCAAIEAAYREERWQDAKHDVNW